MPHWLTALAGIGLLGLGPTPADLPTSATFQAVTAPDFRLAGQAIALPAPRLHAAQSGPDQMRALVELAGSTARAEELLRDSVSAPFVLKLRDVPGADGATVRLADLVFAVHAELGQIDPDAVAPAGAGKPVEAGNMRFEGHAVEPGSLKERGIEPPPKSPEARQRLGYVHTSARLLDRIGVEATTRVEAAWNDTGLIVASQTDRRFDGEGPEPNAWTALKDPKGQPQIYVYEGGAGYVLVSPCRDRPGVLLVEAHFGFVEPKGWFDGNPILRSKLSLIAQDQIRTLRRELQRSKAGR